MKKMDKFFNFMGGGIMFAITKKMLGTALMFCLVLGLTSTVFAFTANNCQNPKNRVSFCESKKDAGRARIGLRGVTKKCQSTHGAGNVAEVKSCVKKNAGIWLGSTFKVGEIKAVEVAVAKKTVKKSPKKKSRKRNLSRKVKLERIFCGSGPVGKNQECWMTSAKLSKEDSIDNGIGKFERICDDNCVYSEWSKIAIVSCNDGFMKSENSCITIPSTEDHVLCALPDGTFVTVDRNSDDFDAATCGVVVAEQKVFDPTLIYWLIGILFFLVLILFFLIIPILTKYVFSIDDKLIFKSDLEKKQAEVDSATTNAKKQELTEKLNELKADYNGSDGEKIDHLINQLPTIFNQNDVAAIFRIESKRVEAERVEAKAKAEAEAQREAELAELSESKTLLETSLSEKSEALSELEKEKEALKTAAKEATHELSEATKSGKGDMSSLRTLSINADKARDNFDSSNIPILEGEIEDLGKEIEDLDLKIADMEEQPEEDAS